MAVLLCDAVIEKVAVGVSGLQDRLRGWRRDRKIAKPNDAGPVEELLKGSAVRNVSISGHKEWPVRILVVEDDPLIREFVVEALRDEGYEVIHAANGEEALAWCRRQVADVLVTDIILPGKVDGWQIAERCREHDPDLPVIYATGFSPVAARPVPGSLSLHKPYRPEDIVRAVKEIGRDR
jgi:CheY-like chemotaxis protein